jgi:hypothetical protein
LQEGIIRVFFRPQICGKEKIRIYLSLRFEGRNKRRIISPLSLQGAKVRDLFRPQICGTKKFGIYSIFETEKELSSSDKNSFLIFN